MAIKRLVKLTFKEEYIQDFKRIFDESKDKIANFPGCHSVELLHMIDDPRVFFTLSLWEDEAALEDYRASALFKGTWKRTKVLFDDRPQAWSTHSISRNNGNEGDTI